ncbi:putative multidrug export ATP-binding/permease protein [compost metagenome]
MTFTYEGKEGKVLENISLKINQGETVALVGPSGTGKSTLTSLLPRFYDINDGKITIDGIDIKEMKLDSLRGGIGIVQQDVFLFDGTIRENVAYGKLGASEDEIWVALKQAQLDEYVSSLPDGLDTLVGERGAKLSGGQKQRISIARMFLKNPRILILDEATSSLDTQTEAAIQKALVDLSKGRTTIIIAHRLSTIKNADKIVVLEGSGIAELGTHEELINNHGVYKNLYEAQSA